MIMITNLRFKLFLGNKESKTQARKNGMPQGSKLAPLFFDVYSNILSPNCIKQIWRRRWSGTSSFWIKPKKIWIEPSNLTFERCALACTTGNSKLTEERLSVDFPLAHERWVASEMREQKDHVEISLRVPRSLAPPNPCEQRRPGKALREAGWSEQSDPEANWNQLNFWSLFWKQQHWLVLFNCGAFVLLSGLTVSTSKKVGKTLNNTMRLITGCIGNKPISNLLVPCGILPPDFRREKATPDLAMKAVQSWGHFLHDMVT